MSNLAISVSKMAVSLFNILLFCVVCLHVVLSFLAFMNGNMLWQPFGRKPLSFSFLVAGRSFLFTVSLSCALFGAHGGDDALVIVVVIVAGAGGGDDCDFELR